MHTVPPLCFFRQKLIGPLDTLNWMTVSAVSHPDSIRLTSWNSPKTSCSWKSTACPSKEKWFFGIFGIASISSTEQVKVETVFPDEPWHQMCLPPTDDVHSPSTRIWILQNHAHETKK